MRNAKVIERLPQITEDLFDVCEFDREEARESYFENGRLDNIAQLEASYRSLGDELIYGDINLAEDELKKGLGALDCAASRDKSLGENRHELGYAVKDLAKMATLYSIDSVGEYSQEAFFGYTAFSRSISDHFDEHSESYFRLRPLAHPIVKKLIRAKR
jgi:hypothetical protein